MPSPAGYFNDLHVYDLATTAWADLSAAAAGAPPAPRYGHCFAAAGDALYAFGGLGASSGERLSKEVPNRHRPVGNTEAKYRGLGSDRSVCAVERPCGVVEKTPRNREVV